MYPEPELLHIHIHNFKNTCTHTYKTLNFQFGLVWGVSLRPSDRRGTRGRGGCVCAHNVRQPARPGATWQAWSPFPCGRGRTAGGSQSPGPMRPSAPRPPPAARRAGRRAWPYLVVPVLLQEVAGHVAGQDVAQHVLVVLPQLLHLVDLLLGLNAPEEVQAGRVLQLRFRRAREKTQVGPRLLVSARTRDPSQRKPGLGRAFWEAFSSRREVGGCSDFTGLGTSPS